MNLMKPFGQYYQIRDDYQNISSEEVSRSKFSNIYTHLVLLIQYSAQKGFAEDIDEGKYSLLLIHALNTSPHRLRLQNILQQRFLQGKRKMSLEMKRVVLDIMQAADSFNFVRQQLASVAADIDTAISEIEQSTGCRNYMLRLLFERLKVTQP